MSEYQTPVIFDDNFDNSYLEDGRFGGQFSDLSMSGYEKPPAADLIDFQNENGLHNGASFAYGQPPYAPHHIYPSALTNVQDTDYHFITTTDFSSQYGYDGSRRTTADPRTRHAPEIISFTREGTTGTVFTICIRTPHDLLAVPAVSFSVLFNDKRVGTTLQPLASINGSLKQYAISGEVPPFTHTLCFTFNVPMKLCIEVRDDPSIPPSTWDVGHFTYLYQGNRSSPIHKRKASESSEYDLQPPSKKIVTRDHSSDSFEQASPYSSFLTTTANGNAYNMSNLATDSPGPNGHQYSTSNASMVSLTAPSPHTPAWSPSFSTVKTDHSPRLPMTPAPRPASTTSNVKAAEPKLVRTSTMQTSPIGVNSTNHLTATQSFNPYTIYPLKATLKLNGDLDAMAKDFTPEEFDARRRLVQFTRSQAHNTINADFKAISPEERAPNSITISCIWWKEKKDCYVTSVDTIFLLESLVGVRFTVEEKNRIRRNLEGFRPLTVSKSKQDSEDFFKVIMGFPNPKPRNIEKDVKVFPWKILSLALKKIISKYSASYASTASAILTPASSAYASTDVSVDCHCPPSPQNEYMDPMPSYQINSNTGYPHGMVQGRVSAPASIASMADLRVQVPQQQIAPSYAVPMNYGYHQPMSQPYQPQAQKQAMSAPIARMPPSWDYGTFVNEGLASMAPVSAPPVHYSRGSFDTAEFVTPSNYPMSGR